MKLQKRKLHTAKGRGVELNKLAGFEKILENLVQKRDAQLSSLVEKANASKESVAEVACGLIDNRM